MARVDWRHAVLWSLLGLASALLFTFTTLKPMPWELVGWLVIYIAWYVALMRLRPAAPIAQALATSLLSAVWVALVQNGLFDTYLRNHPEYTAQYGALSVGARVGLITATAFGFGLVLGAILGLIVRWRLRATAGAA